jgi:hypothetical protein
MDKFFIHYYYIVAVATIPMLFVIWFYYYPDDWRTIIKVEGKIEKVDFWEDTERGFVRGDYVAGFDGDKEYRFKLVGNDSLYRIYITSSLPEMFNYKSFFLGKHIIFEHYKGNEYIWNIKLNGKNYYQETYNDSILFFYALILLEIFFIIWGARGWYLKEWLTAVELEEKFKKNY